MFGRWQLFSVVLVYVYYLFCLGFDALGELCTLINKFIVNLLYYYLENESKAESIYLEIYRYFVININWNKM